MTKEEYPGETHPASDVAARPRADLGILEPHVLHAIQAHCARIDAMPCRERRRVTCSICRRRLLDRTLITPIAYEPWDGSALWVGLSCSRCTARAVRDPEAGQAAIEAAARRARMQS